MKLVTAIISVFRFDRVCTALQGTGIRSMTITEVRGVGRQQPSEQLYRGASYQTHSVPRLRLDIAVSDEIAENVVAAILAAARTGRTGDGKVFVTELDEARRIRDGERGDEAL